MNDFIAIKKLAANLDKVARFASNGKFNSSEIAVFMAIKDEEKNIQEIAAEIGMSCPPIHSILSINVMRKNIEEIHRPDSRHFYFKLCNKEFEDVTLLLFEGISEDEVVGLRNLLNQVNKNIDKIINPK